MKTVEKIIQDSKISHIKKKQLNDILNGKFTAKEYMDRQSLQDEKSVVSTSNSSKPHRHYSIRTKDQIIFPELDEYLPRPLKDMSKEKTKFLDLVDKLHDPPNVDVKSKVKKYQQMELDETEMIIEELNERRLWLKEMESLGCDGQYRNKIITEMKQRMSRLKELEGISSL